MLKIIEFVETRYKYLKADNKVGCFGAPLLSNLWEGGL
jgi:hypothetical protein